jgi:hypothetical protein
MADAGESVLAAWADDQEGLVSPFFRELALRVYMSMERKRLEKALPQILETHR